MFILLVFTEIFGQSLIFIHFHKIKRILLFLFCVLLVPFFQRVNYCFWCIFLIFPPFCSITVFEVSWCILQIFLAFSLFGAIKFSSHSYGSARFAYKCHIQNFMIFELRTVILPFFHKINCELLLVYLVHLK
jgi:hypothetical protein